MQENEQNGQLHQSQIQQLFRCGEKFKRKYLLGHREKTTMPLLQGSASHKTAEEILKYKATHEGNLPLLEDVIKSAEAHFMSYWNTSDLKFNRMERDIIEQFGIDHFRNECIKLAINLSTVYYETFAKIIIPEDENAIEKKWVVECPGYPYDLAGQFDVVEKYIREGNEVRTIRDLKNLNKAPGQRAADKSEQFSFYALAYYVTYEQIMPDEIYMDVLIKKKDGSAAAIGYMTHRNENDFQACFLRFECACKVIEKEAFTPASQQDWWCSEDFCGFYDTCPYVNSEKKIYNPGISEARTITTKHEQKTNGGKKNGRTKKIRTTDAEWSACGN